jgi:hypothetical protein
MKTRIHLLLVLALAMAGAGFTLAQQRPATASSRPQGPSDIYAAGAPNQYRRGP